MGDTVTERSAPPAAELAAMREMNLMAPLTVEILKARYRELCKLHHPDANGGDKGSEERFKRIGQAYKTLMESLNL
jgi:DnaJ-domain-containing protein 1